MSTMSGASFSYNTDAAQLTYMRYVKIIKSPREEVDRSFYGGRSDDAEFRYWRILYFS